MDLKTTSRFAAALALAAALAGCGLTAPRGNAGYANLDSLGLLDVDNTITLSLGPTILRFAASHVEDDPETQALLKGLNGVRIRIYEIDRGADRVAGRLNRMSVRLREQDWEPVAVMKEEGETVHMLVKTTDAGIVGMTVLVADQTEAVVVNIMGDLDPQYFSRAMTALNVDNTPDIQLADSGP